MPGTGGRPDRREVPICPFEPLARRAAPITAGPSTPVKPRVRTTARPSSFRRTPDLIRGVAVRQHGGPLSSFRPEPCGSTAVPSRHFDRSRATARRSPLVISTAAVRQHGGPSRHFDRSRASARRSGETSSPWGREVSPLRQAQGRPLRAFGAPVEMTRGEVAGRFLPFDKLRAGYSALRAPVEMTRRVATFRAVTVRYDGEGAGASGGRDRLDRGAGAL